MSKQNILIVDNNQAFATILKEGIESGGDYDATIVTTAVEARNIANQGDLALAIIDMGLQDEDPVELLKTMRERWNDLRLMCIPVGQLPDQVRTLGIQGVLPKPFFLPEIPAQIAKALSRPFQADGDQEPETDVDAAEQTQATQGAGSLESETDQVDLENFWDISPDDDDAAWDTEPTEVVYPEADPIVIEAPPEPKPKPEPKPVVTAAPQPEPAFRRQPPPVQKPKGDEPPPALLKYLASQVQRLERHLNALSSELGAEAILLTCSYHLVAHASALSQAEAESLAQAINENWQAALQVAQVLGHKRVRFEQSLHEGQDYLLYSLAATRDVVLSAALRADRPLGMVRYNTKRTAENIRNFLLPR